MKKLNKHPRLYKKMANTLKKLITNKILRRKSINNTQNKNPNKNNTNIQITNNYIKQGTQISNKIQKMANQGNDFSRIINVTSYRKLPYNEFYLRLTPFDTESYLKMIKMNYSCRLEIHISGIKSIKYILNILLEKWKNITKMEPQLNLYLIPIRELWIPKELIYFSLNENDRIYDIGDIYNAYGSPNTNILHMKYQWSDIILSTNLNIIKNDIQKNDTENNTNNNIINNVSKIDESNLFNKSYSALCYNDINNFCSNKAVKGNDSQVMDLSDVNFAIEKKILNDLNTEKSEDPLFDEKISKLSKNDSVLPLDTELLDPMELLGFEDDKKSLSNKMKTPSKKINIRHKKINFVNNINPSDSLINSSFVNKSITNKSNKSGVKLRTGYSEIFSNNNSNNNLNNNGNIISYTSNNNLSEVSSHINNSNHYNTNLIGENISNNINSKNSNNKEFFKEKNNEDENNNDKEKNDSIKRKKVIKFVNNVSAEASRELKEKQELERSKNKSIVYSNPSNSNNYDYSFGRNFSFAKENNKLIKNTEKNIQKESINYNNYKISKNSTPIKEKTPKKDPSTNIKNNNNISHKKKNLINNNLQPQQSNLGYANNIGGGFSKLYCNNKSNLFGINNNNNNSYGLNDSIPYIQNTNNYYGGIFDNANFDLFKSNLNNSNLFKDNNTLLNDNNNNQMSQFFHHMANSSFFGNDSKFLTLNNNIGDDYNYNNNVSMSMTLNQGNFNENENNENVFNNKYEDNYCNNYEYKNNENVLNKKRNRETKNKTKNNENEKKQKDKNVEKEFSTRNNVDFIKRQSILNQIPLNIDLPLPSKFFEESNNYQNNN